MFRNDNPDKGTETTDSFVMSEFVQDGFRNDNPDKGTETFLPICHFYSDTSFEPFRNDNPDKGTETHVSEFCKVSHNCLEMITPIRGRKLN